MSRIKELFTFSVKKKSLDWNRIVAEQYCRYSNKKCFKVRKSQPDVSIGILSSARVDCLNVTRFLLIVYIY